MGSIKSFLLGSNLNSFTAKLLVILSYLWLFAYGTYAFYIAGDSWVKAGVFLLTGITVYILLRVLALLLESVINALYYISGTQKELFDYMGESKNSFNEINRSIKETSAFFKRVEDKLDLNNTSTDNEK